MASTIRSHPVDPASRGAASAEGHWAPPFPPPLPSARRTAAANPGHVHVDTAPLAAPPALEEVPFTAAPPDANAFRAEGPLPSQPFVDEANPFKPRRRWRRWLKKPKRELMLRMAIAVVAALVGWGVGAKPWAPAQRGKVAAASAVQAPKKLLASAQSKTAPKTARTAPRRVAATKHTATAPAKSRTARTSKTSAKARVASAQKTRSNTAAVTQTKPRTTSPAKTATQVAKP